MKFRKLAGMLTGAAFAGAMFATPAKAQNTEPRNAVQEGTKPKPNQKTSAGPLVDVSTWRFFYNYDSHFEDANGPNFVYNPDHKLSVDPFLGGLTVIQNFGTEFAAPKIQLMLGLSKSRRDTELYGERNQYEFGIVKPASFPTRHSDTIDAAVLANVRNLGHDIGLAVGGQLIQEFNRDKPKLLSTEKSSGLSKSRYEIDAGLSRGRLSYNHIKLLFGLNSQQAVTNSSRTYNVLNNGPGYVSYTFVERRDDKSQILVPSLSLSGSGNFYDNLDHFGFRLDGKFTVEMPLDDLVLETRTIIAHPSSNAKLENVSEILRREVGYNAEVKIYSAFGNTISRHLAEVLTIGYRSDSYSTRNITADATPTGTSRIHSLKIGLGASVKF